MDILLKYTLKKIQEQTSLIPNINYGGCCHFAKLLAKELENREIKYKVALFDSFIPIKKVANSIKTFEQSLGVGHVTLKIGKYYVDSECTSRNTDDITANISESERSQCFLINYKQLKKYSETIEWNSRFNKRKYHPIISKIITQQFKIYDKLQNDRKSN